MPFNGSGTFTRVMNWVGDATAGFKIKADRHDQEDDNFAAGLSQCLTKDGQTTPTGPIKLGGQRLINVGDPTAAQDAVTRNWVDLNVTGGALIADDPPAAGKVGNLWWDSNSGNLFLRFDDGSSVQWVQVNVASPAAFNGGAFKRTSFTANSNAFQYDETTAYADIECVGGGGGGGSTGGGSGAGLGSAGSGGGGGGYCKRLIPITAAIRAATKTIVVGTAGTPGTNGGDSSYADGTWTIVGEGGLIGATGTHNGTIITKVGGLGGAGSGGYITAGAPGGNGLSFGSTQCGAGASASFPGHGGNSGFGGGGGRATPITASVSPSGTGGGNGFGYGSGGGGGGAVNAVGAASLGGNGNPGIIFITEYR